VDARAIFRVHRDILNHFTKRLGKQAFADVFYRFVHVFFGRGDSSRHVPLDFFVVYLLLLLLLLLFGRRRRSDDVFAAATTTAAFPTMMKISFVVNVSRRENCVTRITSSRK
jgi:lipid-A-disaccharide synthase-like uncharacterized protein